ncbi:MAG TPA: type II toxin-antitoxin system HicA family toxin [Candidatus Solibacter sp.]|nr:type II toxin-antitoxin system HicA family toxin [Candidatus Solibacter sp.]
MEAFLRKTARVDIAAAWITENPSLDRQKGSHRAFRHLKKPMVVTVPGNWNDDLPVGTLKSILRKAEFNESRRFAVVFEKAESNWAAYVPDLPGCITTGSNLQETKRNYSRSH